MIQQTLSRLVLVTLACVSLTSHGAQLDPANMCRAGTGRFATDYTVCTAAIASGKHKGIDLTSLYRHRAKALRYLKECSAALADVDKAIEVTDWSVAAWTERSKINQCLDRMPDALQDAQTAIEHNKYDYESWRQLGIAQFYLGQFEKSEISLSRSLEQNSYNAEANAFRGLAAFGLGRFEDAAWDFSSVADKQFAWNMTPLWLSLSILRTGRDPAVTLAKAIEELDGEWPAPLVNWFLSPDSSISSIRGQAEKAQQLPSALFFMAQMALMRKQPHEATTLFKELLDMTSSHKGQPVVEGVLARRALERLKSP